MNWCHRLRRRKPSVSSVELRNDGCQHQHSHRGKYRVEHCLGWKEGLEMLPSSTIVPCGSKWILYSSYQRFLFSTNVAAMGICFKYIFPHKFHFALAFSCEIISPTTAPSLLDNGNSCPKNKEIRYNNLTSRLILSASMLAMYLPPP
jgi:hypothetical protein